MFSATKEMKNIRHPIFANNEYIIRHDKVFIHMQYLICKKLSIETENWCSHVPKAVCEYEDITVL
jgi:hypothetical protein